MIKSFADDGTEDIYRGRDTRAARQTCPRILWPAALRRLERIDEAKQVTDLQVPPGNRLEKLKGDYIGYHSIRINDQYRIRFWFSEGGATEVQILDYH
ncbi:type II toxin-antitoxin system RelE/ParE family toxin [Longimicrobium terrae]|uniref:Proteic killer suppression protein n=1 Tax=Longimicrobium terrae TaxID=1639882 RepID=A0A841GXZ1_9BACT|nr:type II toxin-antitoxin system RelE/ParE family toxin [Longimicrobium terrae]MBB4636213.1 proteic killer suppression protein [Longimicrobium terrae]MBB6070608.1 proteic killer suppression protein [Longimicrobium terrae]NNC29593.1 plasmid maintenance system killer protein [Longimicrobium terrae]